MFYWKILLTSVNPWLIHSVFTSLWGFFHPEAQHVSHAFRPCSRHTGFFKALFSCRVDLISCTAMLRRQTATSAAAGQPFTPAAHGGTWSSPALQGSLGDFCTGQCCSSPASCGPQGLEQRQMSPQPGHRAGDSWPRACDQPHQACRANTAPARALACPGAAGADPLRLNTNNVTLTSEPEWIHSTDFYHHCLNY